MGFALKYAEGEVDVERQADMKLDLVLAEDVLVLPAKIGQFFHDSLDVIGRDVLL